MSACDTTRPLTEAERQAGFDQQRTGVGQALRPFSGSPTVENLIDYCNRELVPVLRATRNAANDVWKQVVDNAPSANPLAFYFSTTTAAADPTAGRVRLNQATQNTATVIRVSESNGRLQSVQPWLDVMSGGPTTPLGTVTLLDAINPSRFLRFDLNTMTDQGAYWDLGVTFIEGSDASPFVDGEAVTIGFIAGVSAAGSTVPVGSLSPIARDTFIGNITNATAAPTANLLADIDSTSIIYDATSHTYQRAALTSEVTAAQNVNALTVTRSTDFQASPWTGIHQFNNEIRLGTLHTQSSASGALNITLTAGATRVVISSSADVTLGTISGCADGRVLTVEHVRGSGTGNLIVSHDATSANAIGCPGDRPYVVRGRGGFLLVGRQGTNANWKLHAREPDTLVAQTDGGGGGNNFALDDATNMLVVSANATYTGFARTSGNNEGDRFFLQTNSGIIAKLAYASASSTAANRISIVNETDLTLTQRSLVELIYRSSSWRVVSIDARLAAFYSSFTSVSNSTSAVTVATLSIPGNFAIAGTCVEFFGSFSWTRGATATAVNVTLELKINGAQQAFYTTAVITTSGLSGDASVHGFFNILSTGATGSLRGRLSQQETAPFGATTIQNGIIVASIDTTSTITVAVDAFMSGAVANVTLNGIGGLVQIR